MNDPRALVERCLRGEPEAVHGLVLAITPTLQREVNAALLARNLVPQAGRHDLIDVLRDLWGALFADRAGLLASWPVGIALEPWAGRLAAAHAAAVLDRAAPLPAERAPDPATVEAWWRAVQAHDATALPVPSEQREHALALLRPLLEHEEHALAAEIVASSQVGRAPAPGPAAAPARAPRATPDPRRRRGLIIAGGLAALFAGGVLVDRLTSPDPLADLVPPFSVKARRAKGAAPAEFRLDEPIQVILRPATPIPFERRTATDDPLIIGVDAIARSEDGEVRNWAHSMQRTPDGDLVLTGIVGESLPVSPGDWTIYFVIGPRDALEAVSTQAALGPEALEPPIRRVRYKIRVRDPVLDGDAETSSVAIP